MPASPTIFADLPHGLPLPRARIETALAAFLAIGAGLAVVLLGGLPFRYYIAAMMAAIGIGSLCALPDRRAWCLVLWLLIEPLSIETVFYVGAPLNPRFVDQDIVVNAADVLLLLLLVFLVAESLFSRKKVFYWSKPTRIWAVYLLWAAVSYLVHAVFLQDGLVTSAPLELLRGLRTLMLALILQSAIRTRADVVMVLLALLFSVFFESLLVSLSYVTGEIFNFARLVGAQVNVSLQMFSAGSGTEVARATGTLGHENEQAAFHAFFTLPLIGLLAVRRRWLRWLCVVVLCASALAIVFTFSRTGWLAFSIAVLICITIVVRRRLMTPASWMAGATLAIAFAIALGVLAPRIYERVAHGDDGATDSRLRMLGLAGDLFLTHPVIGVGPGEYVQAAFSLSPPGHTLNDWMPAGQPPLGDRSFGRLDVMKVVPPDRAPLIVPLPVHNKYMLTLAELGVPGLLILLWLFWSFLQEARRCSRSADRLLQLVGIGGTGAVFAVMTYMLLDLFADDKSMVILLFVPIFVTAAARCVDAEPSPAVADCPKPSRR